MSGQFVKTLNTKSPQTQAAPGHGSFMGFSRKKLENGSFLFISVSDGDAETGPFLASYFLCAVLLAVEIVSVRKLQQSGVRHLFMEVTRTVFFLLPLGKLCHLSFQRKIKIETHCSIFSSLKIACRYQHCFKFWVLPFLEGHLQILDKNF